MLPLIAIFTSRAIANILQIGVITFSITVSVAKTVDALLANNKTNKK